jgi:DNA-binding response OmpR family regulator
MKRVLVFESDAEFATNLKEALSARECEVEVVEDGEAGIQRAEASPPELIFLAIELPRMNGFSVCNKLKRHKLLAEVPLVLMSSEATDETFEQHKRLRTRAEDYVHKPISVDDLLGRISSFVELPPAPALRSDPEVEVEAENAFEQLMAPRASTPPPLSRAPRAPSSLPPQPSPEPEEEEIETLDIELNPPSELVAIDPAMFPSERPPALSGDEDPGRVLELENQLLALQAALAEAQEANRVQAIARNEALERKEQVIETLTNDLDDLKGRLAKNEKTGSARDFLDLREQLNRKDKEILEVRDGLSTRDREIIKTRDLVISLEREKADNLDAIRALQSEKSAVERARDVLMTEKAQMSQLADDFKAKSESLTADLEARGLELKRAREHFENELLARDAATQDLREQHKLQLQDAAEQANLERERAVAEALGLAQAEARAALEAALETARNDAARAQEQAVRARETELKNEHDARLAALHRAQEESTRKLKAEHHQLTEEAALAAQANLERREQELNLDKEDALAEAEAIAKAKFDALFADKEQAEASRDAKIAALSGDLGSKSEQLELSRRAIDELNGRLSQLEAELASSRLEGQDLGQRLASESERMSHARQKWQQDQAALSDARRALSQALDLIGSAEARHLLD